MSIDERAQHVALPSLRGAPATPLRRSFVAHSPRPLDPDDLPLEVHQTEEERALLRSVPGPDQGSTFGTAGAGGPAGSGGDATRSSGDSEPSASSSGRLLDRLWGRERGTRAS